MPTLPGHRYLGPGNKLDNGKPVDEDDRIAQLHDIAYEFAKNSEDVFRSDDEAIRSFAGDFAHSLRNWELNGGDFVGVLGLGAKTGVERILRTTLYPWNPGKDQYKQIDDHVGRRCLEAQLAQNLYEAILPPRRRGDISFSDFWSKPTAFRLLQDIREDLQTSKAHVGARSRFQSVAHEYGSKWFKLAKQDYITRDVFQNEYGVGSSQIPSSGNPVFETGDKSSADRRTEKAEEEFHVGPEALADEILTQELDQLEHGGPHVGPGPLAEEILSQSLAAHGNSTPPSSPVAARSRQPDTPVAGPSGVGQPSFKRPSTPASSRKRPARPSPTSEPKDKSVRLADTRDTPPVTMPTDNLAPTMEVDQQAQNGTVQSGGGSRGGSSAGTSSAANTVSFGMSRGGQGSKTTISHSRLMFLHGLAPKVLDVGAVTPYGQTACDMKGLSFGMAYIPVDWLPFYLTPNEFNLLPPNSHIDSVEVTVTPVGCRTAFEHGKKDPGVATQEWVAIGRYFIGLNKKFPIINHRITTNAQDPMQPSSLAAIDKKLMVDKYYHDPCQAAVLGYPVQIDEYATYIYNNTQLAETTYLKVKDYVPHKGGNPRFDKLINRFMFNAHVGKPICNYKYAPGNGGIKSKRGVNINYAQAQQNIHTEKHFGSFKYKFAPWKITEKKNNENVITGYGDMACTYENSNVSNVQIPVSYGYDRQLEMGAYIHNVGSGKYMPAQPQLHIGLMPTPNLDPTKSQHSFQISSAYFEIKSTIHISHNIDSCMTDGPTAIQWNDSITTFDGESCWQRMPSGLTFAAAPINFPEDTPLPKKSKGN